MFERQDCVLKGVRKRFCFVQIPWTDASEWVDEEGVTWPMRAIDAYWRAGHVVALNGRVQPPPGQSVGLGETGGSRR